MICNVVIYYIESKEAIRPTNQLNRQHTRHALRSEWPFIIIVIPTSKVNPVATNNKGKQASPGPPSGSQVSSPGILGEQPLVITTIIHDYINKLYCAKPFINIINLSVY